MVIINCLGNTCTLLRTFLLLVYLFVGKIGESWPSHAIIWLCCTITFTMWQTVNVFNLEVGSCSTTNARPLVLTPAYRTVLHCQIYLLYIHACTSVYNIGTKRYFYDNCKWHLVRCMDESFWLIFHLDWLNIWDLQ